MPLYPNPAQILYVLIFAVGLRKLQFIAGSKLVTLGASLVAFLLAAACDLAQGIASMVIQAETIYSCAQIGTGAGPNLLCYLTSPFLAWG